MRRLARWFFGILKCKFGFHRGYVVSEDGLHWFHCSRCGFDSEKHPIPWPVESRRWDK